MSHDLYSSQSDIEAYVKSVIAWKVYTGGIEEAQTLAATNGVLDPHVVLRFGSAQPYLSDSSFAGSRYDGVYSTVDALCIGATDSDARRLATIVSDKLLGYRPNDNCSELNYDWGGGTFTVISEGTRPQFYIAWASFRFLFNLSDVGA